MGARVVREADVAGYSFRVVLGGNGMKNALPGKNYQGHKQVFSKVLFESGLYLHNLRVPVRLLGAQSDQV